MRIECPHCGDRDHREFEYLGSAKLLERPNGGDAAAYHDYVYLRKNPTGENTELWQHVMGCSAWLHIVRNVTTHEITEVKLARDLKEVAR
ncbi:sarcosine oxidase subunit delta [Rhodobacterales bacterium 52_120_T64]|nr:sarcosine oxidase subunit delta [Rhodobacterales bacterium 52_120_T64]